MNFPFSSLILGFAGLAWNCSAEVIVSGPAVTEGDVSPASANFSYTLPAAPVAASYEWALLPHRLAAARDYAPRRGTIVQPAGPATSGTISVPILPDLQAEEDGMLSVVIRPPGAATWAQALGAPVIVPEFSGVNGTAEVMFWQDGAVVSRRLVGGISRVETWERSTNGTMVLTSTLQAPAGSPNLFHAASVGISNRAVTVSQPGGLLTWLRDVKVTNGWRSMQTLPAVSPASIRLVADRLFHSTLNRYVVYRLDPALLTGWRQTGMMEADFAGDIQEDSAFTVTADVRMIQDRSRGTEDLWNPAYRFTDSGGFGQVGAAEGMVLVGSAGGIDIIERGPDDRTWGKVATLPMTRLADEKIVAAVAGDWIAVAKPKFQNDPVQGARVTLFLRDAVDRSRWDAAGEFDAPEAGANTRLVWDMGHLVLISFNGDNSSQVTVRKFEGGAVEVRDDDRLKLMFSAAVQFEPEAGSHPAECYAEFALPVLTDTPVAW